MKRDTLPKLILFALAASIIMFAAPNRLQADDDEDTPKGWRIEANTQLGEEDFKLLEKNKFVITNERYKQVFTPYTDSEHPSFVTTDSLLNAFHVLFEESVLSLEEANAQKLPQILKYLLDRLAKAGEDLFDDAGLLDTAKTRATIMLLTALKLLEGEFSYDCGEEVRKISTTECARIVRAEGTGKPEWLGPPDEGFIALDYSRYKPRGFYTKSEQLKGYFRAVSWLQSVPFRVKKDEELLTALLLGWAIAPVFHGKAAPPAGFAQFFSCFRAFIGSRDDWDLEKAASIIADGSFPQDAKQLSKKKAELIAFAETEGGPQINDQIAFAPEDPSKAAEVSFRVVSAYRMPDAVMFGRTTDLRTFGMNRPFPTGLELCIELGSAFAREKLEYSEKEKLLALIDKCQVLFSGDSLYFQYLDCLRELVGKPAADVPGFMKSEAWAAKNCQTVLSGWAQLRHTWALQAKMNYFCKGGTDAPPGFVEPEPEFFVKMGALAEKTRQSLYSAGALGPDWRAILRPLEKTLDTFGERVDEIKEKGPLGIELSPEDKKVWDSIEPVHEFLERSLNDLLGDSRGWSWDSAKTSILKFFSELAENKRPYSDWFFCYFGDTAQKQCEIRCLWSEFQLVCGRLAEISRKQLSGEELTGDDKDFIEAYGYYIATMMQYNGHSYSTPRDDAPRVVDIFSNPDGGGYLEIGIGRARAIWVVYPRKGKEILCKGAVLPYYEFRSSSRLTNKEWKGLLDSDDRPELPVWVKSIYGSRKYTFDPYEE